MSNACHNEKASTWCVLLKLMSSSTLCLVMGHSWREDGPSDFLRSPSLVPIVVHEPSSVIGRLCLGEDEQGGGDRTSGDLVAAIFPWTVTITLLYKFCLLAVVGAQFEPWVIIT